MRRRIELAIVRPHDALERLDPDYPVALRCEACGRLGYGPRKTMQDAIDEHRRTCSARVSSQKADVLKTTILYPRI